MAQHNVDEYAVHMNTEPHNTYIYFYESNKYVGYIRFFPDGSNLLPNVEHSNGIINVHMHRDRLDPVLDLLRNEKPVYFYYNSATVSGLRTGREPTGEEELPNP